MLTLRTQLMKAGLLYVSIQSPTRDPPGQLRKKQFVADLHDEAVGCTMK